MLSNMSSCLFDRLVCTIFFGGDKYLGLSVTMYVSCGLNLVLNICTRISRK